MKHGSTVVSHTDKAQSRGRRNAAIESAIVATQQESRTKVISGSLEPVWNESLPDFTEVPPLADAVLVVHIYDKGARLLRAPCSLLLTPGSLAPGSLLFSTSQPDLKLARLLALSSDGENEADDDLMCGIELPLSFIVDSHSGTFSGWLPLDSVDGNAYGSP